jgi:ubiquinone/menaquinone biosynthesis C-methylase UbiE
VTDVPSVNFDRAAGFYDATRPVDDTELAQTLDLLQRTLNPSGPTLEIGIGTGALALPLAERGWRMTGVDISAAMIAKLVEKVGGAPPLALVRADATAIPFADASFAGAYVRHVFHLIPRWRDVVAELCRVTSRSVSIALGTTPGPWHELWYAMRAVMGPEADHVGLDFAEGGDEQLRDAFIARGAMLVEEATIDHPANATVAEFLDTVRDRTPSWTWRVSQEQLDAALDVGRRWTVKRFGSTEIRIEERIRERWWIFDIS